MLRGLGLFETWEREGKREGRMLSGAERRRNPFLKRSSSWGEPGGKEDQMMKCFQSEHGIEKNGVE
jgi:hypothetical protein